MKTIDEQIIEVEDLLSRGIIPKQSVDTMLAVRDSLKSLRWIPVSERLPELHDRVLVYRPGKPGPFSEGLFEVCSRGIEIDWICNGHAILFDPEYWLPLPPKP